MSDLDSFGWSSKDFVPSVPLSTNPEKHKDQENVKQQPKPLPKGNDLLRGMANEPRVPEKLDPAKELEMLKSFNNTINPDIKINNLLSQNGKKETPLDYEKAIFKLKKQAILNSFTNLRKENFPQSTNQPINYLNVLELSRDISRIALTNYENDYIIDNLQKDFDTYDANPNLENEINLLQRLKQTSESLWTINFTKKETNNFQKEILAHNKTKQQLQEFETNSYMAKDFITKQKLTATEDIRIHKKDHDKFTVTSTFKWDTSIWYSCTINTDSKSPCLELNYNKVVDWQNRRFVVKYPLSKPLNIKEAVGLANLTNFVQHHNTSGTIQYSRSLWDITLLTNYWDWKFDMKITSKKWLDYAPKLWNNPENFKALAKFRAKGMKKTAHAVAQSDDDTETNTVENMV